MSLYSAISSSAEHNPGHYRYSRVSDQTFALQKNPAPFFTFGPVGAFVLWIARWFE